MRFYMKVSSVVQTNPYGEQTFEVAAKRLSLALALLAEHCVPPSPYDNRIGYDCVSGNDVELGKAFDASLKGADGSTRAR